MQTDEYGRNLPVQLAEERPSIDWRSGKITIFTRDEPLQMSWTIAGKKELLASGRPLAAVWTGQWRSSVFLFGEESRLAAEDALA